MTAKALPPVATKIPSKLDWDLNASTGNFIAQLNPVTRLVRSGRDGKFLYRAEYWGDHSFDFPIGSNALTSSKALEDLKKDVAKLKRGRGSEPQRATQHHATKKKSPVQLDREIAQSLTSRSGLSKHQLDLLSRRKPGGGLRAGYLTPTGWHGDPMVIEDRKLRLEALREQPAPRFPKDPGRSHATIGSHADRRKVRYVALAWSNPQSAYPSQRHVEGNYPETNVTAILEGLFQSGIPEVNVEGRDFALTSLDAVYAADKFARDSVDRRRRR